MSDTVLRVYGCCASLQASQVVLVVENPMLEMEETKVRSLGWEDPQEEGMATHSSILAWRIPWTEEPCWLQSKSCKESDTTEWLVHTHMHAHAHTHVHTHAHTCARMRTHVHTRMCVCTHTHTSTRTPSWCLSPRLSGTLPRCLGFSHLCAPGLTGRHRHTASCLLAVCLTPPANRWQWWMAVEIV